MDFRKYLVVNAGDNDFGFEMEAVLAQAWTMQEFYAQHFGGTLATMKESQAADMLYKMFVPTMSYRNHSQDGEYGYDDPGDYYKGLFDNVYFSEEVDHAQRMWEPECQGCEDEYRDCDCEAQEDEDFDCECETDSCVCWHCEGECDCDNEPPVHLDQWANSEVFYLNLETGEVSCY